MTYRKITVSSELTVAGNVGLFVCLPVPEYVYAAEDWRYEAILLGWVNSMQNLGLSFSGFTHRSSALFLIREQSMMRVRA